MDPVSYGLRVDMPSGWVQLPPGDEDPATWADSVATELWSVQNVETVRPEDVGNLAGHLFAVAAESTARGPLLAFALLPSPLLPVAVLSEVLRLLPDDDVGSLELNALAEQQRAPQKNHTKPPEVTIVPDLAAGPAVRVRRTIRGPREGLRRAVHEEVVYLILPPGLGDEGIVLTGTWTDLVLGDVLAKEVDELVAGLRVELDDVS